MKLARVLGFIAAVSLACADGPAGPGDGQPAALAVTSTGVGPVSIGDEVQLVAELRDADGRMVAGAAVSWTSSDPGVATVSAEGVVTAKSPGTADIMAVAGGASATVRFSVTNSDRDVLVAFYNATDGPNWVDNTNWLTDAPLDDWHGVRTDAAGRVSVLSLRRNQLTGEIPAELGDLANLEYLYLDGNQLTGQIPAELGGLANLESLYLYRNQLTGEIPAELGGLANLESLYLLGNQLTGQIPAELGGLANLEYLYLFANQLTGQIPAELGGLANLESLRLDANQLTGQIPAELGDLANLESLRLDDNVGLTGALPLALASLSILEVFWYQGTGLCVPADESFRAWLSSIASHRGHRGTGVDCPEGGGARTYQAGETIATLPTGFWTPDVSSGASFQFSGGQVTIRFSDGGHVEEAGIRYTCRASGGCRIAGRVVAQGTIEASSGGGDGNRSPAAAVFIPARSVNAGGSVTLDASSYFSDPDGDALTYVASSSNAGVAMASVSGSTVTVTGVAEGSATIAITARDPGGLTATQWTPVTVSSGTSQSDREILEALYHATGGASWTNSVNWLTGADLGDWTGVNTDADGRVTYLNLQRNQLTGEIPAELGGLANLESLWLNRNQLTGEIPAELGGLANLERLNLRENQLTGEIPAELGGLANLEGLYLSGNRLTGEIPAELGGLANLEHLHLSENQLTGEIPAELGGLANLEYLGLSNNQLTGEIPGDFLQLGSLDWFDFHDNDGLCAPTTSAFTAWLGGINNWNGPRC